MAKKISTKENIELAEEHIQLAEDLINDEAKKCGDGSKRIKGLSDAAFALEKAEAEIEDTEEFEEED